MREMTDVIFFAVPSSSLLAVRKPAPVASSARMSSKLMSQSPGFVFWFSYSSTLMRRAASVAASSRVRLTRLQRADVRLRVRDRRRVHDPVFRVVDQSEHVVVQRPFHGLTVLARPVVQAAADVAFAFQRDRGHTRLKRHVSRIPVEQCRPVLVISGPSDGMPDSGPVSSSMPMPVSNPSVLSVMLIPPR